MAKRIVSNNSEEFDFNLSPFEVAYWIGPIRIC